MSAACALVVSFVCFQGPVRVKHEDNGLSRRATISAHGFKALIVRDDNYQAPDRRQLSVACIDEFCVRYHKFCVATPGEVRCEYSYAWPADEFLHTLEVSADSAENFADAERAIALLPPDRPETVQLSLGTLSVAAAARAVPTCPRRKDCWP